MCNPVSECELGIVFWENPTTSIIVIKKGFFSMEEHYRFALQLITVCRQFFNSKSWSQGVYSAQGVKHGKKN